MARPKGKTVKRADVIATAVALLETEGMDAVTLSRVAERLGLRTPSLYNHVAGSHDLQQAVVVHILERISPALGEVVDRALVETDPERYLRAWALAWRSYSLANANHILYLMAAPVDWSMMPFAPTWNEMMALNGKAIAGMGVQGVDLLHAARFFVSAVQGYVRLELRGSVPVREESDRSFAWLVDRTIDALRPSAPAA